MVVFALFAHRGMPWTMTSGIGLATAAAVIGFSLRRTAQPLAWLGLGGPAVRLLPLSLVGIALGVVGGILQRHRPGVLPGPDGGIHWFVALACLIGVTEELVYRGWLLGRLAAFGPATAVAITAVAHAAYKTALFALPPAGAGATYNLAGIALWTVMGGVLLGTLRLSSRSLLPPVLAHAAFDAVVYSAFAAAPWWVWG